jgi:hypothetical protein
MTDMPNQLDDNISDAISDETIRRFLLGSLSAAEQPVFEQRLISDNELDGRIRLIELDLADDYACERFKTSDRKLFEQKFLVTADRKGKLAVSELLRDRFSVAGAAPPAMQPKTESFARRLAHFLGLDRRVWRIAFGVVILLMLFATVLLVIKEPRLTGRIANKILPKRSVPRSLPREVNHPTNISSPEHATTPSPLPPHDSAVQTPQRVELFPSSPDIDKGPTLTLSNGAGDILRLQLVVMVKPNAPYRVEVLTIGGQAVFSVDSLPGPPFNVDVPVHLLKSGKYRVRLSDARDVSKKEIASYYFLVR